MVVRRSSVTVPGYYLSVRVTVVSRGLRSAAAGSRMHSYIGRNGRGVLVTVALRAYCVPPSRHMFTHSSHIMARIEKMINFRGCFAPLTHRRVAHLPAAASLPVILHRALLSQATNAG